MQFKYLALLLNFFANITLATFVAMKGPRTKATIAYSGFSFLVALWVLGIYLYIQSTTLFESSLWSKVYYVVAATIPYAFIYFSLQFPYVRSPKQLRLQALLPIPMFAMVAIILFGPWLIEDIVVRPWGYIHEFAYEVRLGPGHFFLVLYYLSYVCAGFSVLWQKFRESTGLPRTQIGYVLLGTVPTFLLGMFFNFILPALGNYRFIWLGPDFTLFIFIFSTYAMMRHRLMDIRRFTSQGLTYALLAGISILIYISVVGFSNLFFPGLPGRYTQGIPVLTIATIVLLYHNTTIRKQVQRFVERFFYREKYNDEEILKNLSKGLQDTPKQDMAKTLLLSTVVEAMKIEHASLYLLETKTGRFIKTAQKRYET